jgi:ribosomal protein S18 acetylase RimI-like enzyme
MAFVLETPSPRDAERLAALKADTFSETFADDNDPVELAAHLERSFSAEAVARQLADPDCETYWVLDDTVPVGYLKVNRGRAQTEPGLDDGLEVEQLYVLGTHHGRGLGGRLLDLAVEIARRDGFGFVWLSVWERNDKAISLYRHRGYEVFDEHVFMFGAEPQTDLLMRLDLD